MSKKRPLPPANSNKRTQDPFGNVVACLTGMSQAEKDKLHGLVEKLGGSYTRDFDPDRNTHLVAKEPTGDKFAVATEFPTKVHIVSPLWVETSWRDQFRVDEADYSLTHETDEDISANKDANDLVNSALTASRSRLFVSCHFYLAGWEENDEQFSQISATIRKNWGTIYWELFDRMDRVTHVVVKDEFMDLQTRNAALSRTSGPAFVASSWVFCSVRDQSFANPARHIPMASRKVVAISGGSSRDKSSIFRDCYFRLRVKETPGREFVHFDQTKIEKSIAKCGGRLLDVKDPPSPQDDRAIYEVLYGYPVSEGGTNSNEHQVTPLWVFACESEGKFVAPDASPTIFLWRESASLWHKFPKKLLRVSVTGFQGPIRSALMLLIRMMGGAYDDSLRTTTSHLICGPPPSGTKYETALQRNMHVVSMEWLLQVAHHGSAEEGAYLP